MNLIRITRIIFFILFCFVLFSCEAKNEDNPIPGSNKKKDEPSLHIEGFTLTETLKGIKKWELKAHDADIFENKNTAHVIKVDIVFYDNDKFFSHLTAEEAIIDMKTKNIAANRNVNVASNKNVLLKTEKLVWNAAEQIFETDAPVKVIRKNSILSGRGLKTSPSLENLRILNDVQVKTDKEEAMHLLKRD